MGLRSSFTPSLCAVGVAAALPLISACGGESAASDAAATSASPAPERGGGGHGGTDPTGTPLYTRLVSSGTGTGQALTANLGGVTYRSATAVQIGCDGADTRATYRLGGEFRRLTGELGLQPHAPSALSTTVTIAVDGQNRFSESFRSGDGPRRLAVSVSGARTLTVTATSPAGACAPATTPYGAIGAASLT